jgi:hypothetical protein
MPGLTRAAKEKTSDDVEDNFFAHVRVADCFASVGCADLWRNVDATIAIQWQLDFTHW